MFYVNPALSYAFTITDAAGAVTYDTIYMPAELDAAGAAVLTPLNVATYAALTALTAATGLVDNGVYCTYARTTEEDGGFGFWRYDSGSSATANGGTILAIDGGGAGRFFRLGIGDAWDLRWFGCIGDGATNDYTAFNSAATFAAAAGKWLDGAGLTYRLNTKYSISGTALPMWRNMTVDFRGATLSGGDTCVMWTGPALGTAINLSGNAAAGATQVTVGSATGIAAGNLYMLVSNASVDYYTTPHRKGEAVTVRHSYTSGTTITLTESTSTSYDTADTARLIPITRTTGAKMRDVLILAPKGDYYTFYGVRIVGGEFVNCSAENGQRAGFVLYGCFDTHGAGGYVKLSNGTGLGYAFDYAGCHNCSWGFEFVEDVGVISDGTGLDDVNYNYWPSRNITVLCPIAKGISRAIWGTHAGVFNWRYGDCNVTLGIESATTTDLLQISSPRGSVGKIRVSGSEQRHNIAIQSYGCLDDTEPDDIDIEGFSGTNVDLESGVAISFPSASLTKKLLVTIGQMRSTGDQAVVVTGSAADVDLVILDGYLTGDNGHCVLLNEASTGLIRMQFRGTIKCTSATNTHGSVNSVGGAIFDMLSGEIIRSVSAGPAFITDAGKITLGPNVVVTLLNSATFKSVSGAGDVYRLSQAIATA